MITTTSGYKKALEESERDVFGNYTWRQAASNIDYQTQLAEAQARQLYGEDVATAYQAATQQRQMIGASALGEGTKARLEQSLADTMSAAYDKYMADYQTNLSTIATSEQKAYSELDKALEERATYMGQYEQEHYKYLQKLDEWYQSQIKNALDENARTQAEQAYADFTSSIDWSKFYNTNEQGATLKTWEQLTTPVLDPETGLYVSLFDSSGNLTDAGRNFYDQMENYYASRMAKEGETLPPSFQEYLYSANPKLYDWANTYNPYSYSPNLLGENLNAGAFKQLVGLESTDEQYSFIERMTGMKKSEVEGVFNDLYSQLTDETLTMDNISDAVGKMKDFAQQLGLKSSDWQQVETQVNEQVEQYLKNKSIGEGKEGWGTAGYVASSAGSAATIALGTIFTIAAIVSATNPLTAGLALPFGVAAGTTFTAGGVGSAAGYIGSANMMEQAEQYLKAAGNSEEAARKLYTDAVTELAAEMQNMYNQQLLSAGGILGSKIGEGAKTVSSFGQASTDKTFDQDYERFIIRTKGTSSNRTDYKVRGISRGNNERVVIEFNGREYKGRVGDAVTNSREVQVLNKYATGNKDTKPKVGNLVELGSEMYVYSNNGWRKVVADYILKDDASRNDISELIVDFVKK